jgi:hypothetical protein
MINGIHLQVISHVSTKAQKGRMESKQSPSTIWNTLLACPVVDLNLMQFGGTLLYGGERMNTYRANQQVHPGSSSLDPAVIQ